MNPGAIRLLSLCLPAVLLLAGCASADRTFIPLTGAESAIVPAEIGLARDDALEYVISSSRLADLPPSADWQLETGAQSEGEYHFISGDWEMIVWPANGSNENRQIAIINKFEKAYWYGHVMPDGSVINTCLMR